jgi:hypothetical protein
MKKLNYYQVHKNKKPRRRIKKRINLVVLKTAIISMSYIHKHAIIVSQQFKSVGEKQLAIIDSVQNLAKSSANHFSDSFAYAVLKYHRNHEKANEKQPAPIL